MKKIGIEECSLVRDELIHCMNMSQNRILGMYSAIVLLLAAGFSVKESLIFLVPFCILVPIQLQEFNNYLSTLKLAAYLVVFADEKAYSWERLLHDYNNKFKKRRKLQTFIGFGQAPIFIVGLFCMVGFALFFDWTHIATTFNIVSLALALFCCTLVIIIFAQVRRNEEKDKQEYIDNWTTLQNEDQNQNPKS
jgi:hypothetical protein